MNSFVQKYLKSALAFSIVSSIAMQPAFALESAAQSKDVDQDVARVFERIKGAKTSFCHAVDNGPVTGYNANEPVRTASVTKTLTTFWAVEGLPGGPNFQYTTKVYVLPHPSGAEVYIEGQRDPFFDRDRFFSLLADLNRKNLTHIERLTFDKNFWFWPDATEFRYLSGGGGGGGKGHGKGHASAGRGHGHTAAAPRRRRHASNAQPLGSRMPASVQEKFFENEAHTDQTIAGNPDRVLASMKSILSTHEWTTWLTNRYQRARAANPALALPQKLVMQTDVVEAAQIDRNGNSMNPLAGKPGVFTFVVKSAPIKMYLKKMNINSINSYAEELFFSLGGKQRFEAFMQQKFKYGAQVANVNSGSGVNLHGARRDDSMLTCDAVVHIIRKMDQDLEQHFHQDLSDVMAVPANDGGTWRTGDNSLIVKTGTMKNPTAAKNLAGEEQTREGQVYFGMFIDRRGGNSGNIRNGLTAMQSNYKGVPVHEAPYSFQPFGSFTHMSLVQPNVNVAAK